MSELMTSPKVLAKNKAYFLKIKFSSMRFYFRNHIVMPGPVLDCPANADPMFNLSFWPFKSSLYPVNLMQPSLVFAPHFILACRWRVSLKIKWITVQELVLSVFNQPLIPDLKDIYHNSLSPFR